MMMMMMQGQARGTCRAPRARGAEIPLRRGDPDCPGRLRQGSERDRQSGGRRRAPEAYERVPNDPWLAWRPGTVPPQTPGVGRREGGVVLSVVAGGHPLELAVEPGACEAPIALDRRG